ncbi:MAG TPA: OmpA family protein [Burkholderiales bacterium]
MKFFALVTATIALLLAGCASYDTGDSGIPGQVAPTTSTSGETLPPVQQAAPVQAPAAAPKKPAIVNIASTELFEFNKATLTAQARDLLDQEIIGKLKELGSIRYVNVNGHADRLGSAAYNQKLSERRADAVRAYLVSKGASPDSIETFGFGKTLPSKSCPDQKDRSALIECLAPNRRVVVEIQGTPR